MCWQHLYVLPTKICAANTYMCCQHMYVLPTRVYCKITKRTVHIHEFHKLYIELLQAHAAFFAVILLLESHNWASALRSLPFRKFFKAVY